MLVTRSTIAYSRHASNSMLSTIAYSRHASKLMLSTIAHSRHASNSMLSTIAYSRHASYLMLSTITHSRHASNSMKIKLNSVKSVFAQFFTTITQLTFSNFFYFLSLNPFNHSFLTSSPPPSPPRLLDTHDTSTKWFTNGPTDMFSSSISVILFFIFFLF